MFGLPQFGRAFLATDFDRLAADVDQDPGVVQWVIACSAGLFIHDASPEIPEGRVSALDYAGKKAAIEFFSDMARTKCASARLAH